MELIIYILLIIILLVIASFINISEKSKILNKANRKTTPDQKRFISLFENYFKDKKENPWKKPEEIAKITKEANTIHYLESSNEFIRNHKGEYTTKKLYEEKSHFIQKMIDQIKNRY